MLRKISHITLMLLLLVLTAGFTVSRHYCGDSLMDVTFFSGSATSCDESGMTCSSDDCCHDESQVFQLDHQYTSPIILDHVQYIQFILAELFIPLAFECPLNKEVDLFIVAESPPPGNLKTVLAGLQIYRL
ncbi:HYC_CC_PP family protein [Gaoshiqia sp. Z1-71]|uniref:HYC_CC_PP family protein n=1 Tax=Gaoshiqia hydrogeniformans TaxID=3290090 RepID=UPI003BF89997